MFLGFNDSPVCTLENFDCYTQAVYKHLTGALESTADKGDYSELDIAMLSKNTTKPQNGTTITPEKCRELRGLWFRQQCHHPRFRKENNSTDENLSDDQSDKYDASKIKIKCNCLPSCNSVNYVTDYRTSTFVGDVGINYHELPIG